MSKTYEIVGLSYEEARRIVNHFWGGLICNGHAYASDTCFMRPTGCQCANCNALQQEATQGGAITVTDLRRVDPKPPF